MKTENQFIHQVVPQENNLHLQLLSASFQMMRMQMMMRML